MKFEKRVLTIFGRVIKPANWFIFLSGIALMVAAPILYIVLDLGFEVVLFFIQGVQLVVEGYGEIKGDEDL